MILASFYPGADKNARKDIKIVPPDILSSKTYQKLRERNPDAKEEGHLPSEEVVWKHSPPGTPNTICESRQFFPVDFLRHCLGPFALGLNDAGPFALSLANEEAPQGSHYHLQHWEIYFSVHAMSGEYRNIRRKVVACQALQRGGVIVFSPRVVHKVQLSGMTLVIEVPSIEDDKVDAAL